MEGPLDSGISVSGDTISSPDSDISLQHQSVSKFYGKIRFERLKLIFEFLWNETGPRSKAFKTRARIS